MWDTHRVEDLLARKARPLSHAIIRGDIFYDYLDRMRLDEKEANYEEVAGGYEILPLPVFKTTQPMQKTDHELNAESGALIEFGAEVLREVLAELKQVALEQKRANLRRWMHNASLRELKGRQGVLDIALQ